MCDLASEFESQCDSKRKASQNQKPRTGVSAPHKRATESAAFESYFFLVIAVFCSSRVFLASSRLRLTDSIAS